MEAAFDVWDRERESDNVGCLRYRGLETYVEMFVFLLPEPQTLQWQTLSLLTKNNFQFLADFLLPCPEFHYERDINGAAVNFYVRRSLLFAWDGKVTCATEENSVCME